MIVFYQGFIWPAPRTLQQFLFTSPRIIILSMADQHSLSREPLHQILHHNKNKQLASSLLLTSSLISHKQKITQNRQEQINSRPLGHIPEGILKASKLNVNIHESGQGRERVEKVLSNIQSLKCQARRLQQDQIMKMGKENRSVDSLETIDTKQPLVQLLAPNSKANKAKKLNKRKIVKGRPQMYALVKKRKFLAALADDKLPLQEQGSNQVAIRHTINEILNKNNILKFITTKTHNLHCQNLYDNLVKDETDRNGDFSHRQSRLKLRRTSAALLKHTYYQAQNGQKEVKQMGPTMRHFSVNYKRYSISNTIE